jgi:hypothetical protein
MAGACVLNNSTLTTTEYDTQNISKFIFLIENYFLDTIPQLTARSLHHAMPSLLCLSRKHKGFPLDAFKFSIQLGGRALLEMI